MLLILICLISSRAVVQCQPVGFQIDGYVQAVSPDGTKNVVASYSARFLGDKSFVSVSFQNGEIIQSGTDGINSYTLNKMALVRAVDPQAWEFGYITNGPFPEKNLIPAQLVWISFGSFNYLKSKTNSLALEVFHDFPAGSISLEATILDDKPGLPKKIRWFVPSFCMLETNRVPLRQYSKGWLGAEYNVLSTTNFDDLLLPKEFALRTFRPKMASLPTKFTSQQDKAPEDVDLAADIVGVVTNVGLMDRNDTFLPQISSRLSVRDWRFKNVVIGDGTLNYVVHAMKWPESDSPSLRNLVLGRTAPRRISFQSRLVAVIIILICFFPLIGIFWRKTKQKPNTLSTGA